LLDADIILLDADIICQKMTFGDTFCAVWHTSLHQKDSMTATSSSGTT
jgi:hypothetical protein